MAFWSPFQDPKSRIRAKTSVKISIAVVLYCALVFSSHLMHVVPVISLILGAAYITIITHGSAMSTVKNASESIKGGFCGFLLAYILALISNNGWYNAVCAFIVGLVFGFHDPYLVRGIFTKLAAVDAFFIVYVHKSFPSITWGPPLFFVVCHVVGSACSVLVSLVLWPQLSSRQFLVEFRFCLEVCKELFQLLSLKIDTEVVGATDPDTEEQTDGLLDSKKVKKKQMKTLERQYSKKLIRLSRLVKEAGLESWNTQRVAEYRKMVEILERVLQRMKSTREAIALGKFSRNVNTSFVDPLFPYMERMQISVISQLNSVLSDPSLHKYKEGEDKRREKGKEPESPGAVINTEEISQQMDQKYKESVVQYEIESRSPIPSSELTRMVFIVFGALEVSRELRQLDQVMSGLPPDRESVAIAVLKDMGRNLATYSPMTPIIWVRDNIAALIHKWETIRKMTFEEMRKSTHWRFPMRFSIGIFIMAIVLNVLPAHIKNDIPHYNPSWPIVTFIIAILPSLGATIRKCFQRVVGTIMGAFSAYLCLRAIYHFPMEYQIVPFVLLMFPYIVFTGYIQQIPKFAYAGTVSGLTFMIVVLGQYITDSNDIKYAAMRAAFISLGAVWVLVVSIVLFPHRSAVHFRTKLIECNATIAELFGLLVEKGTASQPLENGAAEKLGQAKASYQAMRTHLKEAKSELLPFRWSGFKVYERALKQTHAVYHSLNFMYATSLKEFSPALIKEIITPLRPYMMGLVRPIIVSSQRIGALQLKPTKPVLSDEDLGLISISQALAALEHQYFLLRKHLLSHRSLSQLHPQLRLFYDVLFSIREFVREWKILENALFDSFGLGEIMQEDAIAMTMDDIPPPNTPDLKSSSAEVVFEIPPRIHRELMTLQVQQGTPKEDMLPPV